MTVETEVASLTTAVDNLTSAVNVKKSTLDASVANALSHAGTASTHKTGAETAKSGAESARDQAYTYSQSAASAVTYQDLTAIAESKTGVTAKDVFVYDTSKDSDGGAWRKRTQATSWYNETLNTSTRGATKEFPAVAVIVAETTKLTIYDGDDPSMPMWAKYTNITWDTGSSALSAKNGIIGLTMRGTTASYSGNGLFLFSFVADKFSSNTGSYFGNYIWGTTNNLLTTTNFKTSGDGNREYILVSHATNDIAMTVLPNAPIDSTTNLPVPTIAVATDGGVSVIKDDGSVVDITASSYGKSANITFTAEQRLLFSFDDGEMQRYFHVYDIPSSDISNYYGYLRGNALEFYTARPASSPDLTLIQPLSSATLGPIADYSFGLANGLAKVEPVTGDPASGMVSFITSDYNTGYMVGDIKLAALSDKDDTDVVGSGELVTNGDFSNGTTDWAAAGSGATIAEVNNELVVTRNGTSAYAKQTFNTVAGQWYNVTYTVVSRSHSYRVTCNSAGLDTSSTTGTFSFDFKADAATEELRLHCYNSSTATVTFDNVSVRLADHDRSVNNNGLQIHGTIDKDPVATGADLVGYSFGPSTAHGTVVNYLSQPDFTFPSGDASVMFWTTSTAGDAQMFTVGATTSSGPANGINMWMWSNLIKTNWAGVAVNTPAGSLHSGQQFICLVRRGSTIEVYIDGVLRQTGTNSTAISETGLTIGNGYYNAGGDDMALFRISATAPTAEQIAKIYRDEKVLFQEGAKATLYDTSDAVTALAYDDDTGLLHVGNADGRSVFKGLRRVSNTTDAVGTAISASNDLVVEE